MRFKYVVLLLFIMLPSLAHAGVFDPFSFGSTNCSAGSGIQMACSANYKDGLFSAVSCKVMMAFNRGVIPLYCNIVSSGAYLSAMNSIMALFVIIWAVSFLIGSIPMTFGSAMMNMLKLIFIYSFATNVSLFFGFLYPNVVNAPAELVRIILDSSSHSLGSKDFYEYVDKNLAKVFNSMFMPEVRAADGSISRMPDLRLFVLGVIVGKMVPGGSFITALFFSVITGWLITYLNIMVRYMIALIGLIFLLMLTPIFLPALLFNQLKFLTDEWIKMMISFILQTVIVVAFLIMAEPFFISFMDLVRLGFNEIVIEKGYNEYLSSQGKNQMGVAVDAIYKRFGFTPATAEKYVDQLPYYGPKDEFVPWFVMKLLVSMVVIYLTYQWMENVPKFATILAGNARFQSVLQSAGQPNLGSADKAIRLPHEAWINRLRKYVEDRGTSNDLGLKNAPGEQ